MQNTVNSLCDDEPVSILIKSLTSGALLEFMEHMFSTANECAQIKLTYDIESVSG